MKLPSLQLLAAEAARAVRRFPLTLLCSLLLGAAGIYYQRLSYTEKNHADWLFPLLSAAGLGLTLTLNVALAGERYRWPVRRKAMAAAGAVGLLGLWYVLCPVEPTIVWGLRLLLLLLGLHLLVAVVPYLPQLRHRTDTPGFWRYNETLFLRLLTGGLYSGVLYVGCALALTAIEQLFELKLDRHVYEHLFMVLATGFNIWFFLAGVPRDWVALEQEAPYPKGLKLFTQFVLLPLVVLYLLILYAYLARIVVRWELPEGWVSILILAFSVAGIFALLLIHPIRDAPENTWLRTFARWFYRALFPLLGLLFVAIGTRVGQYGITEERYFVLLLAAWLAVVAAYFLWRQGQGIIRIPASLAVVAFLSAGGPWGAFAVAERSQLNQLREISKQYALLKDGKLDGAGQRVPEIPEEARKRISSIFDFFADREAVKELQPFFATKLTMPDSIRSMPRWSRSHQLTEELYDISNLSEWNKYAVDAQETSDIVSFHAENSAVQSLGNGRYWVQNVNSSMAEGGGSIPLTLLEGNFRLRVPDSGAAVILEQERATGPWHPQLTAPLNRLADSLVVRTSAERNTSQELPARSLTLRTTKGRYTLHLYLQRLTCNIQHSNSYTFEGNALLEILPAP
ncbi:DUF4153 domain-containing protein [Hymenobacter yonginensis]|uniref:DUF4153 domain-containing protein n=1 Tax=Hymenobacter yonginensis TaxID=748197 RepID=A0ABY7PS03_9BACT|nr:DUF4153 domain-containing protein [Hymenobacter yonginensis]WBO85644.1 DUF4153 domain-containing protein [Hymenobacter yonginensis]